MPEFAPGDVFVDHRIEGLAGRGGMGVVYRATQLGLDRLVALKVITPALAQEPDFRMRFVAESKAAASIEHPNVIPVYYAGEREGVLFIVMRYVDGPDLRALVRAEGKLDGGRAAHIVAQVAAGLDAAHQHGLVHRDVKPANVLLGPEDHAYLTDFGLTKRTASTDGGLSRTGAWVGTLGYVSPEQIRGERIDARTDVYALGCVLVYALTGQAPYLRDSDEATLWAHLNAPPPSELVPPAFEHIVKRALAKDPADRYPSAGDLGRAALAAAGRSAVPGPERNVARGAAAPPGAPSQSSATVFASGLPADESETRPSPPADGELQTVATARDGRPPRRSRRSGAGTSIRSKPAIAAAVAGLLAAVLALVVLSGDDKPEPKPQRTATAPRTAEGPMATKEPFVFLGGRPNSLTIADGRVWALTGKTGQIQAYDPPRKEFVAANDIGKGGTSIAAGLGYIWAVKGVRDGSVVKLRSLIKLSRRDGRRLAATQIATDGVPVIVTTGAKAVWVGLRAPSETRGADTVVKVSPGNLDRQQAIAIPDGVQYIAVGEGALWVSHRFRRSVLRMKIGSGAMKEIPVDGLPQGIAVGENAVWVATRGNATITRINPRSGRTRPIEVDYTPTQVAVRGGSVWATAREANRLIRIDPDRRRVIDNIETDERPFALDVTKGNSVWLTLVNERAIQRVKFTR